MPHIYIDLVAHTNQSRHATESVAARHTEGVEAPRGFKAMEQ